MAIQFQVGPVTLERSATTMLVGICLFVGVAFTSAQGSAPANETIRKEELRADLFFLASDAMRGRLTETPENTLAAELIASRFERLGLKPMGMDGSYFQAFRLLRSTLGTSNSLEALPSVRSDRARLRARIGESFYPLRFSPSGQVEAEAVFVGFGIHAPELGHDDFKDAPLRGKIALVLAHEPGERDPESVFDGVVTSEHARDVRKALAAQSAGAVAIAFVPDVHNHPDVENFSEQSASYWPASPRRVPRYTLADWAEQVQIPAVQLSPAFVSVLLSGSGITLEELSRSAEQTGGARPVGLPLTRLNLHTDVERRIVSDRNVVAAVEGADPLLKNEWVVVCAHYDHEGAEGDRVWNGADDDGSGTVALLEIAEAYARAAESERRPKRSLLFAAWNSEERGLLGAWAYVEHPIVPLANTIATLNMDMIGRNEEVPAGGGRRFRGLEVQTAESNANAINILGYSYSSDLTAVVSAANRSYELELEMDYDNNPSNLLRRSDQWPFLQRGVPSLFFHTGLHPDYHTEFDVPERIEYDKLERIARLVHQTSWDLAESDQRPRFSKER